MLPIFVPSPSKTKELQNIGDLLIESMNFNIAAVASAPVSMVRRADNGKLTSFHIHKDANK